ncbi:diacylglycerol/polyprenol kinase family protein [Methanosphaerula palustris]|uniref:Phosphatidate cytidylyltransferase n=1 Tax=Methanosphaerula palustris (strain ATCC BAA-1556 / DSM 19958 / E1-9c) TaxID=521011 RepID=B8GE50_METPE|nr:phosphatidate cytidylyltransferase [Methanosphaerula palustris]ACL17551.1 phosphatidate cytidylyltransferase [Methanosphaerula palustris E1-9c]
MREDLRQVLHLLIGLLIAALIRFFDPAVTTPLLVVGLLGGMVVADAVSRGFHLPLISWILAHAEREGTVPGQGTFFFVMSALTCLVLFGSTTAATGVLVLAVLDSVTALVGMNFGRHRVYLKKTAEGTGAGIVVTVGILIFLLPPPLAVLISVVAGLVELYAPVDDNLLIPVGVCLLISVL